MKRETLLIVIFALFIVGTVFASDITIEKLGEWGTGPYKDVFVQGDYAYCAASGAGIDIIDISNPSNPQLIGNCDTPLGTDKLFIQGNYAYVIEGGNGKFQIIKIEDPSQPELIGTFSDNNNSEGLFVRGDYAYIADFYGGLLIVNVRYPSTPTFSARINPDYNWWNNTIDVFVSGNYAYVGTVDGGLWIVDISNPEEPLLKIVYDEIQSPHDIQVEGEYAYVLGENNTLFILNISNPENPILEKTYSDLNSPSSLVLEGGYAYISCTNSLQILNIINPVEPTPSGHIITTGAVKCAKGNYAYLVDGANGLKVIDVSIPSNPYVKGNYTAAGVANAVSLKDDYVYLVGERYPIAIINVEDPANPTLAKHFGIENDLSEGIIINGNYAYVNSYHWAQNRLSLDILDVSDPEQPQLVNDEIEADILDISGAYAFVSGDGLKIVNISDPANPSIGDEFYSGYIPAVSVNGTYAYVQDFLNGLHIFDISDPYSADEVGNCETVYWASSITAYGDYAYIAGGINRCMQIVDVSDPENPIPFGRFFLPGGSSSKTNEIAVSGHLVFVANGLTGLMVIDVSNPENPFLVCSFDTAGFAEDIFIQGDKIYVADGDSGKLYVLQLNIDTTTYIEMNLNNVLYLLNNFSSSITNIETLKSKIDVVIKGIQNGNYNGTYSKLKHDILEKMDGCATNGAPDRNDWVTDCAAQNELYPKVKQCLDLIAGLKKP